MTDTTSTNNNEPFFRPPDSTSRVGNPRVKLPKKYKIQFQRLCLVILEHIQNLGAYEYSRTTPQAGITIAKPEGTAVHKNWAKFHHGTLKALLQVAIEYYHHLHGHADI
jgi:hypothetical protein